MYIRHIDTNDNKNSECLWSKNVDIGEKRYEQSKTRDTTTHMPGELRVRTNIIPVVDGKV